MLTFARLSCIYVLFVAVSLTSAAAHTSVYVTPEILPPQLLAPPPAEGSADWQKEIVEVLKTQKNITAEERTEIRDEQHVRLELITKTIGEDFTAKKFPKTFQLLTNVFKDVENIVGNDKAFWHTRRPYLTDKHVKLLVDPINDNPAYPSGHTASMCVLAEVLGLLYPQNIEALRARADVIAQHRIEAGVHYPVDVRSGKALALIIMGALMNNADFQADLTSAQEEIAYTQ